MIHNRDRLCVCLVGFHVWRWWHWLHIHHWVPTGLVKELARERKGREICINVCFMQSNETGDGEIWLARFALWQSQRVGFWLHWQFQLIAEPSLSLLCAILQFPIPRNSVPWRFVGCCRKWEARKSCIAERKFHLDLAHIWWCLWRVTPWL